MSDASVGARLVTPMDEFRPGRWTTHPAIGTLFVELVDGVEVVWKCDAEDRPTSLFTRRRVAPPGATCEGRHRDHAVGVRIG